MSKVLKMSLNKSKESNEQWDIIYNHLKNGLPIDTIGTKNILNSAILDNAPSELILLLIKKYPEYVSLVNPEFGNNSLHYVLNKEKPNIQIIKAILKVDPTTLNKVNVSGKKPIDVLNNIEVLKQLTFELIIQNNIHAVDDILKSLPVHSAESLLLDSLDFIKKQKIKKQLEIIDIKDMLIKYAHIFEKNENIKKEKEMIYHSLIKDKEKHAHKLLLDEQKEKELSDQRIKRRKEIEQKVAKARIDREKLDKKTKELGKRWLEKTKSNKIKQINQTNAALKIQKNWGTYKKRKDSMKQIENDINNIKELRKLGLSNVETINEMKRAHEYYPKSIGLYSFGKRNKTQVLKHHLKVLSKL